MTVDNSGPSPYADEHPHDSATPGPWWAISARAVLPAATGDPEATTR